MADTGGKPQRPPPMDLSRTSEFPPLCLDAEAEAAAAALAARSSSELRVVTWNVWFDSLAADKRQVALLQELLGRAPDVACLQEVLPTFAAVVRGCAALLAVYDISPQDVGTYGCLMLVRKDLGATFSSSQLPSCMGRTLLLADCCARVLGLRIITTHLESLNFAAKRREQLQVAAPLLRAKPSSIICGDFNFDDTKTWGDWQRTAPAVPPERLENHVLREVLPDFVDAWRAVHPEDPGYTFDGETNPICVPDGKERMRYDRLMVSAARGSRLRASGAELLGTEEISACDWGVKPSDHYGLLVDMAVAPAGAAGEASVVERAWSAMSEGARNLLAPR